jgi:hypothetical protein
MQRKIMLSIWVSVLVGIQLNVEAANTFWTGAVTADWTNAVNWSAGVPANNDYGSDAYFGDPAVATVITNIPYQSLRSLNFTTAGWTLVGNFNQFKVIGSSGSGTNRIDGYLNELRYDNSFDIEAENTMQISKTLRIYSNKLTLQGGGRFEVKNFIGSNFASPEVRLGNITLQVNNSIPYSGGSDKTVVRFQNESAVLELKTTVVSAEALIGTRILDDTGKGLAVTDIGGGYVSIAIAPPAVLGTIILID